MMVTCSDENTHTDILRRISTFGGVQVAAVLINVVRGKLVALLLGPEGMGVSSLYTSSIATLQQFAGLGINLAAVREVAAGKQDQKRVAIVTRTVVRLLVLTCTLGAALCMLLSPWFSLWAFGDFSHTAAFLALSAAVAMSLGGAGCLALLQGLGEVKRLARASLVGGMAGLLLCVPLYYFFGQQGIAPAIIIASGAVFLFYFFSLRSRIELPRFRDIFGKAQPEERTLAGCLVKSGMVLTAAALGAASTQYLINLYVRYCGSVADVGLFQAATTITAQYAGMVFSALALDYYPRLSAVASDKPRLRSVADLQTRIGMPVVTPLACALILTAPWLIRLLLTDSFLQITSLMRWMGMGVILQAFLFPMDYIFMADDNRKVYFWSEVVVTNILWLACSLLFYHLYGLTGLGISFVVRNAVFIFISGTLCRRYYSFRHTRATLLVSLACISLGGASFVSASLSGTASVIAGSVTLLISVAFSIGVLFKKRH